MKLASLLFSFFIATSLMAQSYQGNGVANFIQNQNSYSCSDIFLRFEITQTEFKLFEGGYNCPPLTATFDFFKLTIIGNKLFQNDLEVGTISSDLITIYYYDQSDDSTFNLELSIGADSLHYKETWSQSGIDVLEIEGHLKKNKVRSEIII